MEKVLEKEGMSLSLFGFQAVRSPLDALFASSERKFGRGLGGR
jgi:hypothetical protein